ncbi:MAG: hypothetical protein ACRC9X_05490, partial [Bacteroidales bacterium]
DIVDENYYEELEKRSVSLRSVSLRLYESEEIKTLCKSYPADSTGYLENEDEFVEKLTKLIQKLIQYGIQ